MVKCELVKLVMDVRKISPKILSANLVLGEKMVTVISVYGPKSSRSEEDKDSFCADLSADKVQSKDGDCIVLRDFNGYDGSSINGYEGVHG